MADSTVTIGGDISDLQRKLQTAGNSVKSFGTQSRTALQGIDLGKAFAVTGGIAGLTSLLKVGFDFNQTMKDGEVAIANVLRTFKGLNGAAATSEAARVVQLIAEAEPRAAGGLQELTQGFIASAAAAANAGLTVEENVDTVVRFANALANSGLPLDQLNQEIRSVLTAQISGDSFVGKLLEGKGLNNERIKQLASEGRLYGELVTQLGAMGEAGDTASVAFSTLDSAMKKVLGAITAGLFDQAVDGAKGLATYLEENRDLFVDLGSGIGSAAKELVSFLGFLNQVRKTYDDLKDNPVVQSLRLATNPAGFIAEKAGGTLSSVGRAKSAAEAAISATSTPSSPSAPAAPANSPAAVSAATSILSITRQIEAVEDMRLKLGERQFTNLLRHLTPQLQIEALEKRITAEKEKQLQQLDAGPRSESADLANTEALLDLEEQLARAKQARAQAATAAAEKEAQATQRLIDQAQALTDLQATTELLKAQATGDDKKAAALQRQADIQRAVKDIIDATGLSEAEALRIAQEQQALKEQIATASQNTQDKSGRIDASIAEGGAEAARQRAAQRLQDARDRTSGAVTDSFGTFASADAQQKDRFAAAFGPPQQNPAALDANRNAAQAAAANTPGANPQTQIAQQLLTLVSQIHEAVR